MRALRNTDDIISVLENNLKKFEPQLQLITSFLTAFI